MATIGTVTYPTSTTWEVEVSDLAPGANSFTVSDGTDTVTVEVVAAVVDGAAAGQAGASGSLGQRFPLAGSAGGQGGAGGAVARRNPLGGAATGSAAGSGLADVQSDVPEAGSAGGWAAGAGTLRIARPVAGTAGGDAEASGTLKVARPLSGQAGGQAGAGPGGLGQAGAPVSVPLSGAAEGRAGVAAGARVIQQFQLDASDGSVIGIGIPIMVASAGGQAIAFQVGPNPELGAGAVPLAGRAEGAAGAVATSQVQLPLAGIAGGRGGGAAVEGQIAPLAGEAGGQAGGSAAPGAAEPLSGTAGGQAGGQVEARVDLPIAGRADARGEAGADVVPVGGFVDLEGDAAGHAGGSLATGARPWSRAAVEQTHWSRTVEARSQGVALEVTRADSRLVVDVYVVTTAARAAA